MANPKKTRYQGIRSRKLKDGITYYYVRFEGREKKLPASVTDAKTAADILAEMKASKETVIRISSSSDERTVHDLWLEYGKAVSGDGSTLNCDRPSWRDDEGRYKNHIKPVLGNTPVDAVTDLNLLHRSVARKNISPQTIKHVLGLAVRIMGGKVKAPRVKVRNESVDVLPDETYQQYKQFLYAENTMWSRMHLFVMATGLRLNNIAMAKWSDIDEHGFLHLSAEDTKGGQGKIKLNQFALDILAAQGNGGRYLFPHPDGGHLHKQTVMRHFKRLIKKSGLTFPKGWRPTHSFRHVMATRLLSTGKVGLADVQAQLCHKSAQMTQRYAHIVDAARERIATISDEVL